MTGQELNGEPTERERRGFFVNHVPLSGRERRGIRDAAVGFSLWIILPLALLAVAVGLGLVIVGELMILWGGRR
jgi:hypothetical protein